MALFQHKFWLYRRLRPLPFGLVAASPAPVVAATNNGNSAGNATAHTVNLPASIAAGDLLLVFFQNDGSDTASVTTPASGWTELYTAANSTIVRQTVWARIADGAEGATITVTTSGSQASAHASYRITGWFGTLATGVNVGTAATGSSVSPDPPSLDPASWDVENTLWIACYGWDGNVAQSAYPSDYTANQVTDRWANVGGAGISVSTRTSIAASEDPGVGTIGTEDWVANTIAVRPIAAPVDNTGTIDVSEADDTSSIAALVTVTGTVAVSDADDTSSVSGTSQTVGTVAVTEEADVSSAAAIASAIGSVAVTEAADTSSASGTVGVEGITGTAAVTEEADASSITGVVTVAGTSAITEAADTSSVSAVVSDFATLALTEAADTSAASGQVATTGSVAVTEAADLCDILGVVGVAIVGSRRRRISSYGYKLPGIDVYRRPSDFKAVIPDIWFYGTVGSIAIIEDQDVASAQAFVGMAGSGRRSWSRSYRYSIRAKQNFVYRKQDYIYRRASDAEQKRARDQWFLDDQIYTGTASVLEQPDIVQAQSGSDFTGTIAATDADDIIQSSGQVGALTGQIDVTEQVDQSSIEAQNPRPVGTRRFRQGAYGYRMKARPSYAFRRPADTALLRQPYLDVWAFSALGAVSIIESDDTASIDTHTNAPGIGRRSISRTKYGYRRREKTSYVFRRPAAQKLVEIEAWWLETAAFISGTISSTEADDLSSVAGSSVTLGTGAVSEASDTSSIVSTVQWTGTVAVTEAADISAISATALTTGTIAISEASDTSNVSGLVTVTGTVTATEAEDASSIAGLVGQGGTASITEAADISEASGTVTVTGSIAVTEAADTSAVAVLMTALGTIAASEAADTPSGAGVVGQGGTALITEAADISSASGLVTVTGTIAVTEAADTSTVSGLITVLGTIAATEAADLSSVSGVIGQGGSAVITESADTASASGAISVIGTISASEIADISAVVALISGSGTVGVSEAADTPSILGIVGQGGTVAVIEASDITSASGLLGVSGILAATEAADQSSIAGLITVLGTSANSEAADIGSIAGIVQLTGTVAVTEASDTDSASGAVAFAGAISYMEAPDVSAITSRIVATGSLAATEQNDFSVIGTFAGGTIAVPPWWIHAQLTNAREQAQRMPRLPVITEEEAEQEEELEPVLAKTAILEREDTCVVIGIVSGRSFSDIINEEDELLLLLAA